MIDHTKLVHTLCNDCKYLKCPYNDKEIFPIMLTIYASSFWRSPKGSCNDFSLFFNVSYTEFIISLIAICLINFKILFQCVHVPFQASIGPTIQTRPCHFNGLCKGKVIEITHYSAMLQVEQIIVPSSLNIHGRVIFRNILYCCCLSTFKEILSYKRNPS